jgi:negative regulator of flagellin synthesis FlgM
MSYTDRIGPSQIASSVATPSTEKSTLQVTSADKASKQATPALSPEQLDKADLSSASGLMAQAMEGSDTRSDKVAALQQAIAAGSYSVSSSDVADKLIQSLLDK